MARLTDAVRGALGNWWSLVSDAAANGFTASDTVAAAADLASQYGVSLSLVESSAIATLYGYSARMQHAADAFQGADLSNAVTADMIGTPPWAREDAEQATLPIWNATFEFTTIDGDGNVITGYKTSVFKYNLPSTVGDLFDAINEDAMAMAAKYNVQFVSANPIQLLAV